MNISVGTIIYVFVNTFIYREISLIYFIIEWILLVLGAMPLGRDLALYSTIFIENDNSKVIVFWIQLLNFLVMGFFV